AQSDPPGPNNTAQNLFYSPGSSLSLPHSARPLGFSSRRRPPPPTHAADRRLTPRGVRSSPGSVLLVPVLSHGFLGDRDDLECVDLTQPAESQGSPAPQGYHRASSGGCYKQEGFKGARLLHCC
ncbi:hypothetical protein EJB05_33529, partial [Eragrostis curvula]